ncbi:MAG: DUF4097 family beta strand repeat-containing protein [Bdellovibrionales bacterium]
MKITLITLAFLFSFQSKAQTEPLVSELKGLRIVGYKGRLTVFADPKADRVRFKNLAKSAEGIWAPQVTVTDGWLEIRVVGPSNKQDWRTATIPRQDFEIRSQSLPLVIAWGEGDVTVKGWTQTVQLSHQQGKVKVEDGRERLTLNVHDGDIEVQRHAGRIDVDNYTARLNLKKVEGPIRVENFEGRLQVLDCVGDLNLKSVSGKNFVDNLQGNFEFENQKGEINFSLSGGAVHGKTAAGVIEGRLKGAVDVRIRSEDARVNLALQKGVGARVDVASAKGQVASSFALKVEREENYRVMKGQIPGSKVSSIFVRSQEGELRLRPL